MRELVPKEKEGMRSRYYVSTEGSKSHWLGNVYLLLESEPKENQRILKMNVSESADEIRKNVLV